MSLFTWILKHYSSIQTYYDIKRNINSSDLNAFDERVSSHQLSVLKGIHSPVSIKITLTLEGRWFPIGNQAFMENRVALMENLDAVMENRVRQMKNREELMKNPVDVIKNHVVVIKTCVNTRLSKVCV